jgi:two-component system secretion response regulator SsrB
LRSATTVEARPITSTLPTDQPRRGAPRTVRVVICDDQAPYRFFLRSLLEQQREIEVVGEGWNGSHAIERCRAEQPDLLIIDLDMPVMDGFQAMRHVRVVAPSTRVLVLTGMSDEMAAERARGAGADAVYGKQTDPSHIVAAVLELAGSPAGAVRPA